MCDGLLGAEVMAKSDDLWVEKVRAVVVSIDLRGPSIALRFAQDDELGLVGELGKREHKA
jgi:hypothetical protein